MEKKLKEEIMKRANNKCEFCRNKATQIHHVIYVVNEREVGDLSHLIAVCKKCHRELDEFRSKQKIRLRGII